MKGANLRQSQAKQELRSPIVAVPVQIRTKPMRRTLSFLLASALLLAGIALAGFEITHAEALRPFVLFGAVVIVVAAGLWLLDEFVWRLWRH
jgi:hypothetical protein